MTLLTIVGPLSNEKDARDTASSLDENCSVYSRYIKDSEGYDTENRQWFVERDETLPSGKIFGYNAQDFMKRQYK